MNSLPPYFTGSIFNSSSFITTNYLTREDADRLYLPLSYGTNLTYITGLTPGTATASKALVLDASKNIATINSLTATLITGTLQTAAQPNITSLGTLTGLTNSGNSTFSGAGSIITLNGATSKIVLNGIDTSIELTGLNGHIDLTNSAPSTNSTSGNIRSLGGAYFGSHCIFNTQVSIGGSVLTVTNAGYLTSITAGTVSASKAIITDSNNDITAIRHITGTGKYISTNTESSVSTSTGSIQVAGGIYVALDSRFGTQITVGSSTLTSTNVAYLTGQTPGTATASKALVLDASKGISTITSATITTLTSSTISNSSYFNCTTSNNTATSHNSSSAPITLRDNFIYFRGQSGSDSNAGMGWCGTNVSTWNSSAGFGNPSGLFSASDGPVVWGYSGVVIGNLIGVGTETVCATFTNYEARIARTLKVGLSATLANANICIGTTGANASLNINNNTNNHIRLIYNSTSGAETVYSSIACSSAGELSLSNTAAGSTFPYLFSGTAYAMSLWGTSPRFPLDFGATANDFHIALYNGGSTSNTYGLGANNNALQLMSGGAGGITMYQNTTTGAGASTSKGTIIGTFSTSGNCFTSGYQVGPIFNYLNGIPFIGDSQSGAQVGLWATANTSVGVGSVVNHPVLFYINSVEKMRLDTSGNLGIGMTPTYLLDVSHTSQTVAASYGYLNSAGSVSTGTNTGSVNFSARFSGRIHVTSEIDVVSDHRMKKDISDIEEDFVNKFISIKPKIYTKKATGDVELGYIAQDVVKQNLKPLYQLHQEIVDELIEEDGFINPKDSIFTLNYIKMVPVLHKKIQMMDEEIKKLKMSENNSIIIINKLISVLTPSALKKFQEA